MTSYDTAIRAGITILLSLSLGISASSSLARTYEGVLQDPIALGAWLFAGNCISCHGDYKKERLAALYENKTQLAGAIGSKGCRVIWSRSKGGTLGQNELQALAEYMLKWEEDDNEPSLPLLPPQPLEVLTEKPSSQTADTVSTQPVAAKESLSLLLKKRIATNQVIEGGYLYTHNCYRCHLSYEHGRMGRGLDKELVQRIISGGKTATQMQAFSRMQGGNLKNSQIKAIVSYITTWEKKGENLAIAEQFMRPPALDPVDFVPIRLPRFQTVSGDPVTGNVLFRKNCSVCHGLNGEGYIGSELQTRRNVTRPDLFLKSIIKQGIPNSLMRSWDANHSGSLSGRDIDDVVSAILRWSER